MNGFEFDFHDAGFCLRGEKWLNVSLDGEKTSKVNEFYFPISLQMFVIFI